MGFASRSTFFGITFFFLLGGIALAVLGSTDTVTSFLDANSTPDSDPAGDVLPLIGVIWAGVALLLLVIGGLIMRGGRRDARLMRTGTRAPARIEGVETTGVVVNNVNIGVRVAVTVMPPGGEEFGATIKTYIPAVAFPQAGDVALVAYDPADPDRITFVSDARNSVGGGKTPVGPDGQPLWRTRASRAAPPTPIPVGPVPVPPAPPQPGVAVPAPPAPAPQAPEPPARAAEPPVPTSPPAPAASRPAPAASPSPAADARLSIAEQLEQLDALRAKEGLSDEEFHARRYKIFTSS